MLHHSTANETALFRGQHHSALAFASVTIACPVIPNPSPNTAGPASTLKFLLLRLCCTLELDYFSILITSDYLEVIKFHAPHLHIHSLAPRQKTVGQR